jgi:hypothetical protein
VNGTGVPNFLFALDTFPILRAPPDEFLRAQSTVWQGQEGGEERGRGRPRVLPPTTNDKADGAADAMPVGFLRVI